ncbi:unnamed protein product [Gadus morhua 'NCC']
MHSAQFADSQCTFPSQQLGPASKRVLPMAPDTLWQVSLPSPAVSNLAIVSVTGEHSHADRASVELTRKCVCVLTLSLCESYTELHNYLLCGVESEMKDDRSGVFRFLWTVHTTSIPWKCPNDSEP